MGCRLATKAEELHKTYFISSLPSLKSRPIPLRCILMQRLINNGLYNPLSTPCVYIGVLYSLKVGPILSLAREYILLSALSLHGECI
ncbi:hypothetical protein CEXT_216831 [Caerostris extrusa]|uniref:Uncharacterized protein n=1 Tax=Caerostris extrusa TaxID=172846 RepID=A0AAV4QC27_CAEEX|nr:hypothetical protein CEXT_216831 [Caerostris extrusa]